MSKDLQENAYQHVKANKKLIIEKFTNHRIFKKNNFPIFIFMAGSPGAGKTEFSKWLINVLEKKSMQNGIMRIDADDIRGILPGYNGKNSHLFQKACSKGVEVLFDYASKKKFHAIIDGTFASFKVAHKNIKRVTNKNFKVFIVYKYLDPAVAWGFTKLREKEEGRKITKKVFIDSFFEAKENVDRIKEIFGDKVEIWLVESVFHPNKTKNIITRNIKFDIDNIDNHLKIKYNSKDLDKILKV